MNTLRQPRSSNQTVEFRRGPRFFSVDVSLKGRLMTPDRREHPCSVFNMSVGQASLDCDATVYDQDRIVAYIDELGRIEGLVTKAYSDGFDMSIKASTNKRENLVAKLTWLINKDELGMEDSRKTNRFVPKDVNTTITLSDGSVLRCRVIDLSETGVALAVHLTPPVGEKVTVGNLKGTVVRHIANGIAIHFDEKQDRNLVEQFISSNN